MKFDNLFDPPATPSRDEVFETLLEGGKFRLERIISTGQTTPPGEWYDQDDGEWVALLSGEARLLFEGDTEPRRLQPGEWINIPPGRKHRVEWTHPDRQTVWLAVHYSTDPSRDEDSQ
jgi:cupin 2 domain-containing protein